MCPSAVFRIGTISLTDCKMSSLDTRLCVVVSRFVHCTLHASPMGLTCGVVAIVTHVTFHWGHSGKPYIYIRTGMIADFASRSFT